MSGKRVKAHKETDDERRKRYILKRCAEIDRILKENLSEELAKAEDKACRLYCTLEKMAYSDTSLESNSILWGLRGKIDDLERLIRRIGSDC